MYVYSVTRHNGSLSSITVADPEGQTALFAVESGESGAVLAHTPQLSESWRGEGWAFANVMLATEIETTPSAHA